jgi:cell division protein FtsI (penicillin-binding protein 3)
MKRSKSRAHQNGDFDLLRGRVLLVVFTCCFFILGVRAVWIHVFPPEAKSLKRIANHQYKESVSLSSYRGGIYDRSGVPLALSIDANSYFIDPKKFAPSPSELRLVSSRLDLSISEIEKLSKDKKKSFVWLKRKQPALSAVQEGELRSVAGLFVTYEPKRVYPLEEKAAPLLGFVGLDDKGLFGAEKVFETKLKGTENRISYFQDAKHQRIYTNPEDIAEERLGDNLFLTIDSVIQEIVFEELKKGVVVANAQGGVAIVMDPYSGKILGLANHPTFNPNLGLPSLKSTRNEALMTLYEPGSVIKPLVAAKAYQELNHLRTKAFPTLDGKIKVGKDFVKDAHKPDSPYFSLAEAVIHSSNVVMVQISDELGPEKLNRYLSEFGLFDTIKDDLSQTATGRIQSWNLWRPIRTANVSFGQGFMVTPLAMARAYAVFAGGGNLVKPMILDREESFSGIPKISYSPEVKESVLNPDAVTWIKKVLQDQVEQGTRTAYSDLYELAGKTGTSQKIDPTTRAYSSKLHYSSFWSGKGAENCSVCDDR